MNSKNVMVRQKAYGRKVRQGRRTRTRYSNHSKWEEYLPNWNEFPYSKEQIEDSREHFIRKIINDNNLNEVEKNLLSTIVDQGYPYYLDSWNLGWFVYMEKSDLEERIGSSESVDIVKVLENRGYLNFTPSYYDETFKRYKNDRYSIDFKNF